jgi:hypothetical protein
VKRLLLAPLALLVTPALGALLYDPASGQLPNNYTPNPWSYGQLTAPEAGFVASTVVASPVSASVSGGLLNLNTTAASVRAGWSSIGDPLDRETGYTLSFDLRINAETHASNDRAGVSVIVLSSDLLGIELGFWTSEVWAQNVGFTHGEGTTAFNPAAGVISYDLTIQGSGYTLKANDTTILTGSLRDYSAAGFPYTTPNFGFFGDNTFSAAANSDLGAVEFTVVPEPGEWTALAAVGMLGFAVLRRWQRSR